MNQNELFRMTRWRLASWYGGVMGVILSVCGLGIYQAIAHAHWMTIDRELESVSGTLHDSIEPLLKQPGRLEPETRRLLPDLCMVGQSCLSNAERHTLGAMTQGNYYVRLLDSLGRPVAFAGILPQGLPSTSTKKLWQSLKDTKGNRYHQISLSLHTHDNRAWGYMQVGRSFKEFDDYLTALRWVLVLGLPVAMILVAVSSWWLAGLAMQPLYQSYSQIQQFTADAAHELRTPLAATQATVESVLLSPDLSELELRDILQTIKRQNQRLTQLVADLLFLARLDRQAMLMRSQLCCLNDIVNDLVEELAALALSAKVMLTSSVQMQVGVYVHTPLLNIVGDEEQLYRLVSNLIVNAIQYTSAGGEVKVVLERSDNHAIIQVQDTGIGIPVEEQRRIFERFYRVNSDRSRGTGGSGLGLAIATAIVQAHHGNIQVQSELGKGSIFSVRLPLGETADNY
ncbi:MAG: two-component system sensor histidine kinase RppB [Potamolinea sp.]